MKIRIGFVSNSSSASMILDLNFLNDNKISLIDSIDKDEIFKEIMKEIKNSNPFHFNT